MNEKERAGERERERERESWDAKKDGSCVTMVTLRLETSFKLSVASCSLTRFIASKW